LNRNESAEELHPEFHEKMEFINSQLKEDIVYEYKNFNASTRDMMRVDVGLIISRPAIFLQMHEMDFEFFKYRT
jgi:hypothetical protein